MLEELGLERVTIPLPFRLNHVHCFIGETEKGHAIMDTGLHDRNTMTLWKEVLGKKEVSDIILTHVHPDHTGCAGTLQEQMQATVHMSERDARTMQEIWTTEALPHLEADYKRFAVPHGITSKITSLTENFQPYLFPLPSVDHFLEEGKTLQFGKEAYEIIHTPGHADGLVCFYQADKEVLLSTDHILPKITPNVAYWFYSEPNPLRAFELSLEKIKKLPISYVVPSHGEPFEDVYTRIDEIWGHHEERLAETLDYMKEPITVFAMCQLLFQQELSVYDLQFAIGETMSHMEYLRLNGDCERVLADGHWLYERK